MQHGSISFSLRDKPSPYQVFLIVYDSSPNVNYNIDLMAVMVVTLTPDSHALCWSIFWHDWNS